MSCEFCGTTKNLLVDHREEHVVPPRTLTICKGCHTSLHLKGHPIREHKVGTELKVDMLKRITLPPILRSWGEKVIIYPWTYAALIWPSWIEPKEAIKSVEILLDDMRHQMELEEKKEEKK